MKKLTLLLIALIGVLTMNAKVVTEQEALLKAQRFMQGKRFMQGRRLNQSQTQARRVAQKNVPAYYIFNVEHEDGFVIVSGDDRTPEILGYSEHGNLNPDNAPDNVKWWLSEYERQIEWLLNSADEGAVRRAAETSHRNGWAAIEPLVESHWNQSAPYNDLCPTVDGERTPTGCVATAMAQIMNYHQWPVTGTGSNSYDWNGQTLSMDFSNVTFDWENMQNTYYYNGEDDSSEAKSAVATLMYACGISFNMNYGLGGSSAFSRNAAKALLQNFGYTADYVSRNGYELSDWESMIYTDLTNKRPVYYSGSSSTSAHAFVCDGYSTDGLFHINWGWGGSGDGYFLLSVLDPYGGENGFSDYQEIIYGICPVQKALIDGIYYNLIMDYGQGRAIVIPSDEGHYTGDIVIPSMVVYDGKTYNVTKIEEGTFSGCTSLTSVNIPNSIKSIGQKAFQGCSSLTSVNIPEGVESIGLWVFDGCSSLTSVNIPESVTSIGYCAFRDCSSLTSVNIPDGVTSIGDYVFWGCSSLTSINIPDGVTSIGSCLFWECSSLLSVNIPEKVTSIGQNAFYGCSSLTSIDIPDGVTSIEYRTFDGCSSLTSIDIPNGVTSIGAWAFGDCSALTSIDIPDGVTSIEYATFYGCSSLTSIDIPNGVTSIGDWAFGYCSALTSINIPENVMSIGERAFLYCYSLTSINIPENVTNIGGWAFSYCYSLTTVICRAENVPELGENAFLYVPRSEATLYVPTSALENYKAADQWKDFGTILPLEGEEIVTLIIDEAHYATFIAPFDVEIPANVIAYTVSGIKEDGETLQLEELTGAIPANTPVVLYSNDIVNETVTGIRTTQGTTYTYGLLTGVYKDIEAPQYSYVLQNQNGKVAFYYVNNSWNQPAVKANHAYLTVPNANGIKAFRFGDDDETTGIQATMGGQENKAVIYDLTGRRVEKAVKGMYIIDGKKVMVK